MNRQRLILFILVIVLVVTVVWSYFFWPRPKVAPNLKYAAVRQSTGPAPSPAPPSDARILRLDLLEREQGAFKGYRRNIFRPIFVDEIKAMKQKAAAVKPVPLPPPPAPPPPPPPPTPEEKAAALAAELKKTRRAELGKFVFKGFLSKGGVKTIFLSKGDTMYLVKKGDTFEKWFKALSITDQALTVKGVDTGDEIVIPLIENLNLRAAP